MIQNYNIANHGSLTKGQYLESNNYIRWSNLFGSIDRCFKFWSLKGDISSFEEKTIIPNSSSQSNSKYYFDDNKLFSKQELFPGGGYRTEISFENFQRLNCQKTVVKKYGLQNELKSIETHELKFNRICNVRFTDMSNKKEHIKNNEFRRTKKLDDLIWILEDDRQSEKIKFYFDKGNRYIIKTIEFKNSKYDKWKRIRTFNGKGQIMNHSRNALNKDDKNEYWETKEYTYNSDDNLINVKIKFNNGEDDREHTEKYFYKNQQLKEFSKYAENGRKLISMGFDYDKIGNPIEIKTEFGIDRFEYTYDETDNWINMIRTHENNSNKNTFQHNYTRKYEYK